MRAGQQQRFRQGNEIAMRKWFFQEMNRANSSRTFAVSGQVHCGQDYSARVRMTRAQIVKKFLPKIVGRIDIEDEETRPLVYNQLLRLLQTMRDIDMRLRRRFAQSSQHRAGQVFVRRENKNPALGLRCGRFVQSSKVCDKESRFEDAPRTSLGMPASRQMESFFSMEKRRGQPRPHVN